MKYLQQMFDLLNKVSLGDCLKLMDTLPDNSVHCVVTSPPYWALRDYGKLVISHFPEITFSMFGIPITVPKWSGQIGHEDDPMLFTAHMVYIFRKVHRVLRKDGTLWLNFGDSYATAAGGYSSSVKMGKQGYISGNPDAEVLKSKKTNNYLKPKDLCGIPWMVAFALRDDGWYLRQDNIWSKPNPMPESVQDRCTKSHEYIFHFSKSKKYFFDAQSIKKEAAEASKKRWSQNIEDQEGSTRVPNKTNGKMKAVGGLKKDKQRGHSRIHAGFNDRWDNMTHEEQTSIGANKRSYGKSDLKK